MVNALGEQNNVYGSFLRPYQNSGAQNYVLGPALDPYLRPKADEDTVELKKQKDPEKRKKAALGLSVSLGAAVIIFAGGLFGLKNPKARENFKNLVDGTVTQLQENEKLKSGLQNFNVTINFANAKDVYIKKFFDLKLPGFKWLRKFDNATSKLYENLGIASVQGAYKGAQKALDASDKLLLEQLSDIARNYPEKAELARKTAKTIKARQSQMSAFISNFINTKNPEASRFKQLLQGTEGIDDLVRKDFEKCLKKGGDKKRLFNTFVSEDILSAKKEDIGMRVMSELAESNASSVEIARALEKLGIDSTANTEALKKFEKAWMLEGNDLFDKMRDIGMGCAATDFLGAGAAVGGLGIYLAQAETKEERTSAALRNGLPIVTAVGVSIASAASMVSGIKSMAIGIGAGLVAGKIFGEVDKSYRKKHGIDEKALPDVMDVVDQLSLHGKETKHEVVPEMIAGSRVMPDSTVQLQLKDVKK